MTAFILLVALLILPLNSLAGDLASEAERGSCACQQLWSECGADGSEERPERHPINGNDGCCDSEERGSDAAMARPVCGSTLISARQMFRPDTKGYLPKVYLSIFVPPEN
ncbi:MAG: hypothetical protein A2075_07430 [Geobacteraceae bacterium GWC2_58_44]|nr:MAG: hypothetical protein A2075_07430 [Geobacteraceae bacterium GWC2_58_44]HBG07440.1 hypothetical protein [Geobacter sp.]